MKFVQFNFYLYTNIKLIDMKERLEELRAELRAERISYGELVELESLAEYIDKDDLELLGAIGINEY